jgi:hypothetical protein
MVAGVGLLQAAAKAFCEIVLGNKEMKRGKIGRAHV